mgnify:CR=1 FL=1
MENKLTTISICLAVGLCGFGIMIKELYNNSKNELEVANTTETSTSSTTILETTKTTKKVVKTTKKVVKKKTIGFNIKASKSEMQGYAHQRVKQIWGEEHWNAFYQLVSHESGWNANSINKKTGACGLFQFVPCSKGGKAYKTDYKVQIEKGIQYIKARYGDPNNAWKYWQKHHWY